MSTKYTSGLIVSRFIHNDHYHFIPIKPYGGSNFSEFMDMKLEISTTIPFTNSSCGVFPYLVYLHITPKSPYKLKVKYVKVTNIGTSGITQGVVGIKNDGVLLDDQDSNYTFDNFVDSKIGNGYTTGRLVAFRIKGDHYDNSSWIDHNTTLTGLIMACVYRTQSSDAIIPSIATGFSFSPIFEVEYTEDEYPSGISGPTSESKKENCSHP